MKSPEKANRAFFFFWCFAKRCATIKENAGRLAVRCIVQENSWYRCEKKDVSSSTMLTVPSVGEDMSRGWIKED